MVVWPSDFLEAWGATAKKHTFSGKECFCVWPGYPRPPKAPLGQTKLRDHFETGPVRTLASNVSNGKKRMCVSFFLISVKFQLHFI